MTTHEQNSIFSTSIWTPTHNKLIREVIRSNRPIRIAIEGLPNSRLEKVLGLLQQTGYSVYNHLNLWDSFQAFATTNKSFNYLLQQMTANAPMQTTDDFQLYYNLYSISPIWLEWISRNKLMTQEEDALLRKNAEYLFRDPDYIIYLYTTDADANLNQIYREYEWILDNIHCPYPLYKVHLSDSIEEVLIAILKILNQIRERVELGI
jgi:hypothetical protein